MSLAAKRSGRVRTGSVTTPDGAAVSQFVVVRLGSALCGVDIAHVQEVTPVGPIAMRPTLPGFLDGVVHRRGREIPIVDLRTRFNLPHGDDSEHARIIVTIVRDKTIGFIVDGVIDVVRICGDRIETPPPGGIGGVAHACIVGFVRLDVNPLIVLNIGSVLSSEEFKHIPPMAE